MTKLVASLEGLQGRKLTAEEVQKLQAFQKLYEIDDDDPLLVVLAMMANSQLVLESAPALLQAEVSKTIEHHRTNMRDQAVLISKDLIGVITKQVQAANDSQKPARWPVLAGAFGGGMVFMMVLLFVFKIYFR